ncbi:MAG: hypothetical protein Q4G66_07085 [bacterium]|nr:hypothetical protein [bacterium]
MASHKRMLLVVLLLLAALPAYWLGRDLGDSPDPDELLPADTLLFIHWNNFARFSQGVEQSPVAKQVRRKDFPRTMQELGLDNVVATRFEQAFTLVEELHSLPLAEELLQQRGMLALLANRNPELDLLDSICANLIFILPGDNEALKEGIQALSSANSQVAEQSYQGATISQTRLQSGRSLFVCNVHGFTLYAFAVAPLQRCLDQATAHMVGGTQAAHGQKSWLLQHRLVPRDAGEFFFYADIRALQSEPLWESTLLSLWQGLLPQQAVVSHAINGHTSGLNTTLRFDPQELKAWMNKHQLADPAQPPVAASRDAATLLHFWSNWFTRAMLDQLTAAIKATELGAPLLAAGSSFFGQASLDQEDFYHHFTTELGLVIRGEKNQSGQLKPLFSVYFKSIDNLAVQENLKRLFKAFPLRRVKLEHGAEATAIGMAGGMVQPAYALIGSHLVLADNLHMVQQVEKQLRQGGEEFVNLGGRAGGARKSLGDRSSLYLFLRNKQVADSSALLLRYLASAKNEKGVAILKGKQKLFVEQIALPVIATIGQAESSRFFLSAAGDEARASWQFSLE